MLVGSICCTCYIHRFFLAFFFLFFDALLLLPLLLVACRHQSEQGQTNKVYCQLCVAVGLEPSARHAGCIRGNISLAGCQPELWPLPSVLAQQPSTDWTAT